MVFMIKQGTKQMTQSNGNIIGRIFLLAAILFMMVIINGYADLGDIWVHPPQITAGNSFAVEIRLDMGFQSISSFKVEIVFDPAVLQLDLGPGVKGADIQGTGWALSMNANDPGHLSVAGFNVLSQTFGGIDSKT